MVFVKVLFDILTLISYTVSEGSIISDDRDDFQQTQHEIGVENGICRPFGTSNLKSLVQLIFIAAD